MAKKKQEPVPFNDRLILFRYFLKCLGKDSLKELSKTLNSSEYEGYDENQNTWFYVYLKRFCSESGFNADKLRIYDENICRYVKQISEKRDGGIVLKYYQYISLLFTEMYLDRYFSDRDGFIKDLNSFIDEVSAETLGVNSFTHYTAETMNKLAFMCATGSGKTLIMHINILQFLHYLKRARRTNSHIEINNIIVLSPNEGMSEQHLEELKLSSISAKLLNESSLKNDIIVIDMNKLKEEGKVKTVSVDSFEQNNLVFIDEGHKGLTGDVWKKYRNRLFTKGFAFEYSATFKQALGSKSGNELNNLIVEYGKSIIMDYSYKYFYDDGYGKDYRIYNLKENITEEHKQTYLVGCLMSFYQQMKLYDTNKKELMPFHIEKPLLVFVGNRVSEPINKDNKNKDYVKELLTDVEEVLSFIDKFVHNKADTIKKIDAILNHNTGLYNGQNELFSNDFVYLKSVFNGNISASDIFIDILRLVFNVNSVPEEPRLHIINLKQSDGEIGLKIGVRNDYFGVISVGDAATLIKKCENKLVTDTEEFASESMFKTINNKDSKTNILIGSRKFTEGWNSWRVSTMGLINFAKSEGSQAIQLFGRGVRLRGYEGCLKRSGKIDKRIDVPKFLPLLETLTIFGIKAQYMEDFRKFLEIEDVKQPEEIHLKIHKRFDMVKDKKLQVIQIPKNKNFQKQSKRLILDKPDDVVNGFGEYLSKHSISIDCRSKVQAILSDKEHYFNSNDEENCIESTLIPCLNYTRIYTELLQYKNEKHFYNIIIDKSKLQEILQYKIGYKAWYSLIIPKNYLKINTYKDLENLTDYAIIALKRYIDRFYMYHRQKWEYQYLSYVDLEENDKNFYDEYKITITDTDANNIELLKEFIMKIDKMLAEKNCVLLSDSDFNSAEIKVFDFEKHLYAPLLSLQSSAQSSIQSSPLPFLNSGEEKFVILLKDYLSKHIEFLEGKELYLLRNKSKTGIGFFEADNFYPDFILWIKEPNIQRISFIDPKGLMMIAPNDSKIQFCNKIKMLQKNLANTNKGEKIILNSFIFSVTDYDKLISKWGKPKTQKDMEALNILFLNDTTCIENLLNKILSDNS